MHGAVAVDLGATSGRFAAGRIEDGRIVFDVIKQIPHSPVERNGRLEWQTETLLGLCREAAAYADAKFDSATIGIDAWGVDHGFLNPDGSLRSAPVCYRDASHPRVVEQVADRIPDLYRLTGIQHQPLNTSFQLLARRLEDPSIVECEWLMLPDLLGRLLGGASNNEMTEASTTQLLGLDQRWSEGAFEIIGWPVPRLQPTLPGKPLGGLVGSRTRLAHVGSHDTASAVAGFGKLDDDQVFLNVGTWSLIGTVLDQPNNGEDARAINLTNELCVDGRVRLLKNVPGFYIINRLHDELGIAEPVPTWLAQAEPHSDDLIDFFDERYFNPRSMVEACSSQLKSPDKDARGWATTALMSLVDAVGRQPADLSRITGRRFTSIRVGGGGSQSAAFCQALADRTGLSVVAGPAEATVVGNLAAQFLASGHFVDWSEAWEAIGRSTVTRTYEPSA